MCNVKILGLYLLAIKGVFIIKGSDFPVKSVAVLSAFDSLLNRKVLSPHEKILSFTLSETFHCRLGIRKVRGLTVEVLGAARISANWSSSSLAEERLM